MNKLKSTYVINHFHNQVYHCRWCAYLFHLYNSFWCRKFFCSRKDVSISLNTNSLNTNDLIHCLFSGPFMKFINFGSLIIHFVLCCWKYVCNSIWWADKVSSYRWFHLYQFHYRMLKRYRRLVSIWFKSYDVCMKYRIAQ